MFNIIRATGGIRLAASGPVLVQQPAAAGRVRASWQRRGRRRRREPRPLKPVLSWRRCAGCKPCCGPKADTPGGTTRTPRLELGVFVEVTR